MTAGRGPPDQAGTLIRSEQQGGFRAERAKRQRRHEHRRWNLADRDCEAAPVAACAVTAAAAAATATATAATAVPTAATACASLQPPEARNAILPLDAKLEEIRTARKSAGGGESVRRVIRQFRLHGAERRAKYGSGAVWRRAGGELGRNLECGHVQLRRVDETGGCISWGVRRGVGGMAWGVWRRRWKEEWLKKE